MADPSARSGAAVTRSTAVLDDVEDGSSDALQAPPDADPADSPGIRRAALVVSGIALMVLVVAAVFGVLAWNASSHEADRRAPTDAARQVATNLTSIAAGSVDADLQRLLDSATGEFRDEFERRRDPFIQIVQQAQVTTRGQVVEAGFDRIAGDEAHVLVAVHSQVQNSATNQPEDRDYRLAMTMQRVDGRWLAAKVEFVA